MFRLVIQAVYCCSWCAHCAFLASAEAYVLEYSELLSGYSLALTARCGRPGICQRSQLKSRQQGHATHTGRRGRSAAAASWDVGQASGGEQHIKRAPFPVCSRVKPLTMTGREQSVSSLPSPPLPRAMTMAGKQWDNARVFAAEGSGPEQAGYRIRFLTMVHLIMTLL